MRIFGIDPGSQRTGYGCVETDGRRHRLVTCGAIGARTTDSFPERLAHIHRELFKLLSSCRPDCVALEGVFHAMNVRSALKLGHARGVAMLAAVEAGCLVAEYSPAEVKRAVVGYGRAEKHQVQEMVRLLLGLDKPPFPYDAADALAVAICHLHSGLGTRPSTKAQGVPSHVEGRDLGLETRARIPDPGSRVPGRQASGIKRLPRSWRQYRPPTSG